MRLLSRVLPIVAAISLAAAASYADTIVMKNGRVVNGNYLGGTPRLIKVEVGDNIETFDVGDIARIEFSNAPTSSRNVYRDEGRPTLRRAGPASSGPVILQPDPSDSRSYPTDDSRPTLRRAPTASSTDNDDGRPTLHRAPDASAAPAQASADSTAPATPTAPAAAAAPVEVPVQTEFVVRTIDAIDSQSAKEGDLFRASLDQPIVVNNQTVVPAGADVQVKLVQAEQSGKFTGKTELTLSLWSVTVNGKVVQVNTQDITKASEGRGAQTAKVAGGAAAVGAVIGAIAGGGKGAAIGAGAGGAAGAAVQVATKGQRVKVASETLLTFVLDKPVTI